MFLNRFSRSLKLIFLLLFVIGVGILADHPGTSLFSKTKLDPKATQALAQLPAFFIQNQGQFDSKYPFYAQGLGYQFLFSKTGMTYAFAGKKESIQATFTGANSQPHLQGDQELAGKINYLIGKDQSQWKTHIPTYGKVVYKNIYPGIDYAVAGKVESLESEFRVTPGADLKKIELAYTAGVESLKIDQEGNLLIQGRDGTLTEKKPYAYQEIKGKKVEVESRYWINGVAYGFAVGAYDSSRELVIDPSLVYSTYLGGSDVIPYAIAVDSSGNAYVAGLTASSDFSSTAGAYQTTSAGSYDAFVIKLDSSGSSLLYSTYLGGSSIDLAYALTIDSSGNATVAGKTSSSNFPTTAGAYQTTKAGSYDAFVAKLDSSGSALTYSTYLGGSSDDYAFALTIDSSGNTYVTGYAYSSDFPTTSGAYDTTGSYDVFVTKLNSSGSTLTYSTYLGGSSSDYAYAIAIDSLGNAYVAGVAWSSDFPTTSGAYQTTSGGGNTDAFVAKLDSSGSALTYSTYLGGSSDDGAYAIAVDSSGNAYVTGYADSDFPTTSGAYDTTFGGSTDAFVTKLNSSGSALTYSTYLGGSSDDYARALAIDSSGNTYVAGYTTSSDFPTTAGAYDTTFDVIHGEEDITVHPFVSKLDSSGASLTYSTYLGGSLVDYARALAIDSLGNTYVTGDTVSSDFPTTSGAYNTSGGTGFVTKFCPSSTGSCTPAETCNGTDDDGDGVTDQGCYDYTQTLVSAFVSHDSAATINYSITNTLAASTSTQHVTIKFVILNLYTGVWSVDATSVDHQSISPGVTLTGDIKLALSGYTDAWQLYAIIGVLYNDNDTWTGTTWLDYDWNALLTY